MEIQIERQTNAKNQRPVPEHITIPLNPEIVDGVVGISCTEVVFNSLVRDLDNPEQKLGYKKEPVTLADAIEFGLTTQEKVAEIFAEFEHWFHNIPYLEEKKREKAEAEAQNQEPAPEEDPV